jgi:ribose/xylose/arabinose/galactoside ABC-type transport system permease subunit
MVVKDKGRPNMSYKVMLYAKTVIPRINRYITSGFKKVIKVPFTLIVIFTLFLSIFLSFSTPNFLTLKNWMNISRQISTLGIMGIAMNLVILSKWIDLSIGSIMGLSLCVGGTFINLGWNQWIVFFIVTIIATFLGFFNGWVITKSQVPPVIVTLATLNIYRGLAYIYTKGYWIVGLPDTYMKAGRGVLPLLLWVFFAAVTFYISQKTRLGKHVYAVGGNEQAAIFAGVDVRNIKLFVYCFTGFSSAIGGIIFMGRTGVVQPIAGMDYEFQAIAAVVVGGTSIFGGEGSIIGTFVGALIIGIILNGLTLLGVSAYWQGTVTGLVIITAVLMDSIRRIYG